MRREGEVTLPIRGYTNPDNIKENTDVRDLGEIIYTFKGDKIKGSYRIKRVQKVVQWGVLVRLEVDADDLSYARYQKI